MGAAPYIDFRWVGNEAGFARDPYYPTIDENIVFVESTIKANKYISRMMLANLAANGVATSDEDRCVCYEAQNILLDNDDCIFATKDDAESVTINITLPEGKTFNTFTIAEKIELGISVSGYKISAKIESSYQIRVNIVGKNITDQMSVEVYNL